MDPEQDGIPVLAALPWGSGSLRLFHDSPIPDEVDQLEDPSVIYDLHSLPQFAIDCIANSEEGLFNRFEHSLVSRLRSSEDVRIDK